MFVVIIRNNVLVRCVEGGHKTCARGIYVKCSRINSTDAMLNNDGRGRRNIFGRVGREQYQVKVRGRNVPIYQCVESRICSNIGGALLVPSQVTLRESHD